MIDYITVHLNRENAAGKSKQLGKPKKSNSRKIKFTYEVLPYRMPPRATIISIDFKNTKYFRDNFDLKLIRDWEG